MYSVSPDLNTVGLPLGVNADVNVLKLCMDVQTLSASPALAFKSQTLLWNIRNGTIAQPLFSL